MPVAIRPFDHSNTWRGSLLTGSVQTKTRQPHPRASVANRSCTLGKSDVLACVSMPEIQAKYGPAARRGARAAESDSLLMN